MGGEAEHVFYGQLFTVLSREPSRMVREELQELRETGLSHDYHCIKK